MSEMTTQRFRLVLATDGTVSATELVDALDALGYRGLMVVNEATLSSHEHPCPSGHCLMQLRHEGHHIPAEAECCVCWAATTQPG